MTHSISKNRYYISNQHIQDLPSANKQKNGIRQHQRFTWLLALLGRAFKSKDGFWLNRKSACKYLERQEKVLKTVDQKLDTKFLTLTVKQIKTYLEQLKGYQPGKSAPSVLSASEAVAANPSSSTSDLSSTVKTAPEIKKQLPSAVKTTVTKLPAKSVEELAAALSEPGMRPLFTAAFGYSVPIIQNVYVAPYIRTLIPQEHHNADWLVKELSSLSGQIFNKLEKPENNQLSVQEIIEQSILKIRAQVAE